MATNANMPSKWTPSRISKLRERLGWTQEELGIRVSEPNMSPSSAQVKIARYENGSVKISAFARMQLDQIMKDHEIEL